MNLSNRWIRDRCPSAISSNSYFLRFCIYLLGSHNHRAELTTKVVYMSPVIPLLRVHENHVTDSRTIGPTTSLM